MKTFRHYSPFASFCVVYALASSMPAATPVITDKRDREVLEITLLHLLTDSKFDMTRVPTNGATIVLHTRTPEKTGFIQSHQMRHDIGGHTLPDDAERDLRSRNSQ